MGDNCLLKLDVAPPPPLLQSLSTATLSINNLKGAFANLATMGYFNSLHGISNVR